MSQQPKKGMIEGPLCLYAAVPEPGRAGGEADERRARRRAERGATLVEYVLFVSAFVLVGVGVVGGLNEVARTYFAQSASRIGQPSNSGVTSGP